MVFSFILRVAGSTYDRRRGALERVREIKIINLEWLECSSIIIMIIKKKWFSKLVEEDKICSLKKDTLADN